VSRYSLFIGPKDLDTLKALGKQLERSIDFGYFGFISIPLLYVLHFSHQFTASYGIDIILLTVLIKILMAPLTHKSFVSMKKMQKLQPQMERLKEKFANEKEKLNKEIMELYRRNGVNPLGGCLPMVLQFPVFIGLYNALSTPIELRHAPFMWIKDLSRPDWESLTFIVPGWWPAFLPAGIPVLTILMGASMFLQQWMTPSAGDPNQRKMMMLMPLMFTFMFVSFPAGLTVYWLINNILSIGQQYWINRSVG
jgi:YidC/Oxa1 family membrane protein insertase